MDVDNIPLGVNFKDYLDAQLKQCDVLLAIIGLGWLESREQDRTDSTILMISCGPR